MQRFVPAPGQGQRAHAAPVRLFEPGLHLELQPRGRHRLLVVADRLEARVLVVQDFEGQPVIVLLLAQHPALKSLAVRHRETGQEIGAERLGQKLRVANRHAGLGAAG